MANKKLVTLFSLSMLALTTISACSSIKPDENTTYPMDPEDERRLKHGKLTGEDGIQLFGPARKNEDGNTIGVNSYLWRASLDTLSFMPLQQVDPLGGVIITDWYENPEARGERFKLNVVITGSALRADGVRVTVFKQVGGSGGWRDVKAGAEVGRDLEDKILTRAREFRINGATDD